MHAALCVLLALPCPVATPAVPVASDTIRLEVGSKEIDGRVYKPHAARVRIRVGDGPVTTEWTNELAIGDSAGRRVMRWVTKGTRPAPNGGTMTWELRQTYDLITLRPYGYHSTNSLGGFIQLALNGTNVRGTKKTPMDSAPQPVDITLDQAGFFAGASDLLPAAVGFKPGTIMLAPFWSPAMTKAEMRVFTVIGKGPIDVEGERLDAWKVSEHRYSDKQLLATWYLLDTSPYMVYGEVPLPNGQVQKMSEVAIPMTGTK
jgi:hypothetical protein